MSVSYSLVLDLFFFRVTQPFLDAAESFFDADVFFFAAIMILTKLLAYHNGTLTIIDKVNTCLD
ncbi:MAG: hypothetical protein OES27_01200 [Nitrosopumilus sp.]|nr:hypothetical protein [Nitrosopumilus sp.]